MQLATVLVQEEGHGHAPAALAADTPVGPVGDHVAQAAFTVFGVKLGLLDGVQRQLAQRLGCLVLGEYTGSTGAAFRVCVVHANKPLGGRAVDHRRLVTPAVRVAVLDQLRGHQPSGVAQRVDDDGAGLPDIEPTKQRQLRRVLAVALHRVQNIVVLHTVGDAAVEVIHAIGGG